MIRRWFVSLYMISFWGVKERDWRKRAHGKGGKGFWYIWVVVCPSIFWGFSFFLLCYFLIFLYRGKKEPNYHVCSLPPGAKKEKKEKNKNKNSNKTIEIYF